MSRIDAELTAAVEGVAPVFLAVTEVKASARPQPGAWSAKEIIGHLIDSAANNHRRFVEAQFSDELVFPGYDQDAWISVQRYQERPWLELVSLWRSYNQHLAHVMASVSSEARERIRRRHNLHQIAWRTVPENESTTLGYFMQDYVDHLGHHVRQALRLLGLPDAR